jgi:hypothetical protein
VNFNPLSRFRFGRASVRLGLIAALLVATTGASCNAEAPQVFPNCERNSADACTDLGGFPVGRMTRVCGATGIDCGEVGTLTRRALDARVPGHLPVVDAREYERDMNRVCGGTQCGSTSVHEVVIFTFVDGSHRVLGFLCPGIAPCKATITYGGYDSGFPLQGEAG